MGRGVSSVLRPALLFFDDYSVSVGGYAEEIGEIKRSSAGIDGFGFERNVVEVYADDGIAAKIVSCLLELFQRLRIALSYVVELVSAASLARPQKEGPSSQLGSRRTPEPYRSCSRELARVHGDS